MEEVPMIHVCESGQKECGRSRNSAEEFFSSMKPYFGIDVYKRQRLEKIKKITGLDLREFEDAIVFKVALMVKKYLSSNPVKF